MISITLTPKIDGYTRTELKKEFNKYSNKNDDLDEFIVAMIKTGQLQQKGGNYFPEDVTLADEQVLARPKSRTYDASRYGAVQITKKGTYPRLAIAGLKSDDRPDPTSMYLDAYQDEQGNWHSITEKTHVLGDSRKPAKPRSSERWRANIPAEIVRKYNIKPYTPIRVKIDKIVPRYFGTLTLYGYKIRAIISFVSTSEKNKGKTRDLEIIADNFPVEINQAIKKELNIAGKQLIRIMEKWLNKYDAGYYSLYIDCTATEEIHKGEDLVDILVIPPTREIATIKLNDLNRGKTLARGETYPRRNWVDEEDRTVAGFFLGDNLAVDVVLHGYKGRDRKYTVKKEGKKITEKTVNRKAYSKKKSELKFSNKPGYK